MKPQTLNLDTLVNLGADASVVAVLLYRTGALTAAVGALSSRVESIGATAQDCATKIAKIEGRLNGGNYAKGTEAPRP